MANDYEPQDGEPVIGAPGLRRLADEAQRIGAYRYAEAYRIVAERMAKLSKDHGEEP